MNKLLKCILLLSGLLGVMPAQAAPVADTANAYKTQLSVSSSASWTTATSATVVASDNLLLVYVWTTMNGVGTVQHYSSITWNGAPLTYVGQLGAPYVYDVELWELTSPTAGTGTISGTFPQSITDTVNVVAVPWSGVNTTTPLGTLATNNSGASPGTVTATGATSSDTYSGFIAFNGSGTTITSTGTGQVSIISAAPGTADSSLSSDYIPGSDAGAFSWTSNGPVTQAYALAIAVKGTGGSSCTHAGITSAGAIAIPNGTSGSYQGKTGAFVTPDCSTIQYKQPTVGNFGVN